MKINQAGIDIIKEFEGLRLIAYRCPAGKLTIGYGHTGPDVHPGMVISKRRAEQLLKEDIAIREDELNKLNLHVNENQFSALMSWVYNFNIQKLGGSTLLKKIWEGDLAGAALQFERWKWADGKVQPGLVRRRAAEAKLFLS